jgi:hypothetical protein
VSVFLQNTSSRHSVLTKQKTFSDKPPLKSNSTKLTSWLTKGTDDAPIDLDEDDAPIRFEEEDEPVIIDRIPEARKPPDNQAGEDSDDALFVASDSEDDFFQTQPTPASKRRNQRGTEQNMLEDFRDVDGGGGDEKKKLGLQTRYDGFAIYGRIVCLVVKRRGGPLALKSSVGQAMMETWVSTQVAREMDVDVNDRE